MDIADIYTEDVYSNLKMYAVWHPIVPLGLGDYGTLEGRRFIREGNITDDFNIKFKGKSSPSSAHYEYKSAGMVETSFKPKGSAGSGGASVNASLDISFSGKNAVFFNAAECAYSTIDNMATVSKKIIELYYEGEWKGEYKLVSDMINAGATTIIVSGHNQASISLEASSPDIQIIDLTKASIGLTVKSEKNIGLNIVSKAGLTPLIALRRVVTGFLGDVSVKPAKALPRKTKFVTFERVE